MKDLRKILAGIVLMGGILTVGVSCDKEEIVNTYTVSLPTNVTNGTISVNANTVNEGDTVTITVTPEANYQLDTLTVNGTSVEVDENNQAVIENVVTNLDVEVSFKGVDVTVGFIYNETTITTKTFEYGKTYGTLPELSSIQEGYTFNGWYLSEDGTGNKLTADTILTTATAHNYYAYCLANSYQITLDVADGDVSENTLTATYDSKIGTLPVPTKAGYVFVNYTDSQGNEVNSETVYKYTSDVTLTANYAKVDFKQGDVRIVKTHSSDANTIVVKPTVTFNGKDITNNYTFTLQAKDEGVVNIDGMSLSLVSGADNVTTTITLLLNDLEYGKFNVTGIDYVGANYTAISTKDEFIAMVGTGKYYLTSDIDMANGWLCETTGDWNPLIMTLEANAVIDGNGHNVSNANLPGGWSKGWIMNLNGTIRNLSFTNINLANANPFGTGLVGFNKGLIENVFLQAKILSDGDTSYPNYAGIGGVLAGVVDGGKIKDVVLDISVKDGLNVNNYGAFTGKMGSWRDELYNSYAIVHQTNVKAYYAEGAEGVYDYAVKDGTGKTYKSVHTFLQEVLKNNKFNSFWTVSESKMTFNGKDILISEPALSASIASTLTFDLADENSYVDIAVYAYGEITEEYSATYRSSDESIFTVDEDGIITFVKAGSATLYVKVNDEIDLQTTIMINNSNSGSEEETIIKISTVEQWKTLITANPTGHFQLENDIDLAGGFVTSAADACLADDFTGTLDGNGHLIKNGWMPGGSNKGIFKTNNGTIKNIGFVNVYATNMVYDTGLVSFNKGTMENIFMDLIIVNTDGYGENGGVLAAYLTDSGVITNCIVNLRKNKGSDVVAANYGSLIGKANSWASRLNNCYSIVNDTGIADIAYTEAAANIIGDLKNVYGSAQFNDYSSLFSGATLTGYDSTIWEFSENTIKFGGQVVLSTVTVAE